ncbi:MAG: TolC family protein, partial [Candidatus Cloacimonetes bacterium]|nr:TolC family protein [Candidatus Cloacimonadota bacterium]
MKRISILIGLLILVFPLISYAAEYILENLIEIGLEKSYDIQQETVNYQNSRSYLRSSFIGVLPTITANTGKSKIYNNGEWSESASFTVSKSFFLNEPSYYNIHTSLLDKKNSELSLKDTRKQIAYIIFSSYLYVLEAQKTLDIQQENLKLQEKIHNQIKVQFDAGEKSLLELKQSEISLIDYEIAVNEAENSLSRQRKDLFSYLGIEDEGFDFLEPEFIISKEIYEFTENYTLIRKKNSIKSSKIRLLQSGVDFLPSLSISYTFNYDSYDGIYEFDDYDKTRTLSLNASYDIFNLLEKRESFSRSKRNLKMLKLDLENSERNYRNNLKNLNNDLETL